MLCLHNVVIVFVNVLVRDNEPRSLSGFSLIGTLSWLVKLVYLLISLLNRLKNSSSQVYT